MKKPTINTLGELKSSGYKPKKIKDEIRNNLIEKLTQGSPTFTGILGYEDTVIPDVERALLSRHNILFLGLRGQAKTRMARQMLQLLDDYIPCIAGSEINDDPLEPISPYALDMIAKNGDQTAIEWIHKSKRFGEKLATPDVSVADLIGDIDPIKAANLKLSFAHEGVLHYGIIPRSNRSIFVINELPDLQARIQVALFNILEEGDIQIRGFKLRLPLDILFVFTANPEDYTNRGSIVTPLKDRIQSQILTHYPKTIEIGLEITQQEAKLHENQKNIVHVNILIKKLIEQIAIEARHSELVDKKSGVSARLTISAYQNAISAAERRVIINKEKNTQVWISDLGGIIPSITGKIELVYEGEQEGPYQVAMNLIDKAIRTLFIQYFPNPDLVKKKRNTNGGNGKNKPEINPYKPILDWFDGGNNIQISFDCIDNDKLLLLHSVTGLKELVTDSFPKADTQTTTLLMEFVLYGLSAYSLISKKQFENNVAFNDLMGSMLNFTSQDDDDEFDEEA